MAIRRGPGPASSAPRASSPPPFTLSRVKGILGSGSLGVRFRLTRLSQVVVESRFHAMLRSPLARAICENRATEIRIALYRPQRGFVYTATGRIIDRHGDGEFLRSFLLRVLFFFFSIYDVYIRWGTVFGFWKLRGK